LGSGSYRNKVVAALAVGGVLLAVMIAASAYAAVVLPGMRVVLGFQVRALMLGRGKIHGPFG